MMILFTVYIIGGSRGRVPGVGTPLFFRKFRPKFAFFILEHPFFYRNPACLNYSGSAPVHVLDFAVGFFLNKKTKIIDVFGVIFFLIKQ